MTDKYVECSQEHGTILPAELPKEWIRNYDSNDAVEAAMHGDMSLLKDAISQTVNSNAFSAMTKGEVPATAQDILDDLADMRDEMVDWHNRSCLLCPAVAQTPQGMYKHFVRCHIEVWTDLAEWIAKGEEAMPIRSNASNRQVYAQMRLWGWTEEKRANLEVVMRAPSGSTLKIHSPESHARNQPPVLIAIYQMTGVSADEFWDKPNEDEAHFSPEPPDPVLRNYSTQLLDLLLGQGRPLTVQWMAESMGLSTDQVQRAMNYMKRKKLVRKVKSGMWLAIDQREVQEHQQVDMQVTVDDQTQTPVPEAPLSPPPPTHSTQDDTAPSVPVENTVGVSEPLPVVQPVPAHREITDQDVLQILDLLVPDGFKAIHYPAVDAWVQATKQLVQALREK